ncbi:CBS domain-containing protein CBSX5 [Zea mays]|uniref:CBS domain-containing protein CBSX5 n=2 Tax=Zea mays TaxID=4577 RepID=A0A8J8XQT8_MAIZE|nr:CBS domain-containing protein CBSX5 [Zea mays]PWZ20167.1 CBS domain-containing protein CBSX5 [Zea mays]
MAVNFLANELSDLCIGKPAVRSLPLSAATGDLAAALRRVSRSGAAACVAVTGPARAVVGRVGPADVLCLLCTDPEALARPAAVFSKPVSALLPKDGAGERGVPFCSILEALDAILSGAQVLAVPLRAGGRKKQLVGAADGDFCWLTQEDLVRYFLNYICLVYNVAARSVSSLGLVRADFLSVRPGEAALSAVPLIRRAVATETAVAVVAEDGHLVGEISPALLAACDETAAAAIATLSAADLMAYIDHYVSPPEHILRAVKAGLKDKGLDALLALVEDETLSSFSSLSSASSSSDEEAGRAQLRRPSSGSYGRRAADEPVVCSPASSLVAVLVQALAHRVSYVWVLDEDNDCRLAGIVTFADVLRVFREQLL